MHLRHLMDEKIALWKWLAETCEQPGNRWEYQVLYEAALRSRFHGILLRFLTRNKFEVCSWDGHEIEGFNRKTFPRYHAEYADGSLEPFVQQEYLVDTPIDLDWEETTKLLKTATPFVVAGNPELEAQWQREWGK